ncbi:MAG: insulinase family protein [Caulobacteraceae bacterium]|nr:insulinase family protein [Caulobacteraceae bacterium]
MPSRRRLANGVVLICDPAPGYDTLALSVVAGRGARSEDEGRAGWSHLLEHMVFKGAGDRSARDIVEVIEAEGGQINAATSHERTSFQVRALAGGLPLALAVVADLVQRPTLDEADLAREKQVVAQEIAEAFDTPDDQVFERAQAAAFAGQPLGRPVLGAVDSLAPADPAGLETWRAALYAPDQLVVSVAGRVDEDAFVRDAEALFGSATAAQPMPDPSPAVFTGGTAHERRRLEQAHLVFLLPGASVNDADYWASRLFADMLGGGMSSRLFQEARERLGLAYAIDAYAEAYADAGVIGVYAGCAAADASPLAEVVAGEIRKLAERCGADELARAKAQLKSSLFMGRESLGARAEQAAQQQLAWGDLMPPSEIAQRIEAVDSPAIEAFAARMLAAGRAATSVLGPARAGAAAERFERALFG